MRAIAIILSMLAAPAIAQQSTPHVGPGEWIPANPAYVTAEGQHCCGTEHCRPPKADEIIRINGGWLHIPTATMLMDGDVGVYPSKEVQSFACVWGGALQCFFPSTGG